MANMNWNDFGEQIRDAVDSAVSSGDFTDLSRSIGNLVNTTIDNVKNNVKENIQTSADKNQRYSTSAHSHSRQASYSKNSVPNAPVLYNRHPRARIWGIINTAVGFSLMILGLIGLLVFGILSITVYIFTVPLVIFGTMSALGLGLGINGSKKLGFINRFQKYVRHLNQHLYIPLQSLADKTGKSLAFTARDLQKMIDQKLFYQGHLDTEDGYLILSDQAYEEYQEAKADYYAKQKELAKHEETSKLSDECQKLIDDGQAYINHIRTCNDLIPGEEISAKLDKMEQLVSRIFDEVRLHPEVAPDLQKMMDYYLPTTSKLLDAYRELDSQPISGENISSTKKEIESAVDTLNIAFEKLLDSLFADRAWDISSDISVLNTMLAQEGLTKSDF